MAHAQSHCACICAHHGTYPITLHMHACSLWNAYVLLERACRGAGASATQVRLASAAGDILPPSLIVPMERVAPRQAMPELLPPSLSRDGWAALKIISQKRGVISAKTFQSYVTDAAMPAAAERSPTAHWQTWCEWAESGATSSQPRRWKQCRSAALSLAGTRRAQARCLSRWIKQRCLAP